MMQSVLCGEAARRRVDLKASALGVRGTAWLAALLLLFAVLVHSQPVLADSTGEHAPTGTAALPPASPFTNATNAYVCNDQPVDLTATGANNQVQTYSGYALNLPQTLPTPVVTGIQVHVRALNDGSSKNRKLRVSLSPDGGKTFTDTLAGGFLQTRNLRSTMKDYFLGGSSYLWGRAAWTASEVSDLNFKVKVMARNVNPSSGGHIQLDCIPVTVFYQIPGAPDLTVSKTASPDPVQPLQNLTYTITYGNTGGSTATNVIVSDTLPANTTFVSANPAPFSAPPVGFGGTVLWNVGSVPVGGGGAVTLTVQVAANLADGTQILNDTYNIRGDQNPAPTAGNPVSTTVQGTILLTLSKSYSASPIAPYPVAPNGILTYVLTIQNSGLSPSTGIVVSEGYPPYVTYDAFTSLGCGTDSTFLNGGGPPDYTWTIASLASGATCTITITTTVQSPLADGTLLVNQADISDSVGNAASASTVTTVEQCAGQADGSACNDQDLCTQADACLNQYCVGSPVVCTVSDQCHLAGTCSPTTGCSNPSAPDATLCDDGNPCTTGDACTSGVCAGTAYACAPPDQCHLAGTCNGNGTCSYASQPDGTSCSDGNACTTNDTCSGGTCVAGPALGCDDNNACTTDSCDSSLGCQHVLQPNCQPCSANADCDNHNACDGVETCVAGRCQSGTPPVCNDGNPCTDDTCDPANGCTYTNNTAPCNDGNACTTVDVCQSGTCTGTAPVVCTALDQCHDVGTCDTQTGVCSTPAKADNTACNDGNACTQTDVCLGGVCTGTNPVVCAAFDQCHDVGTCDTQSGVCSNPAKADNTACNDGNACTQTDACQSGICVGTNAVVCSALDQCHVAGTCDPGTGVCSNPVLLDNTACNDGDACTQSDVCLSGVCTGTNPVVCNALDQCHAAGTCDTGTGACSNPVLPDNTTCNDGDACTQTDVCLSGACTGTNPVICDALDQCHAVGQCNPVSGVCSNPALPDNTPCTDNNACTVGDVCIAGTCSPGSPLNCDDGNPCTDDLCDRVGGCRYVNNNNPCNDGNACTSGDACSGGRCVGTPYSCAPPDQCHQAGTCNGNGTCSYANQPDGTSCSDGNACTLGDTCKAGTCTSGALDACNDGNACTTDSCDPQLGCQHPLLPNCEPCSTNADCDNHNACDGVETCVAGKCQSGTPPHCDDGNPCTTDTCDPTNGCTYTANTAPCDDGNGCTVGDFCSNKVCQPGAPKDCNDHNVCTDDTCSAPSGVCLHTPNTAQCSDGNACTQTDTCQNGSCVGGNSVACAPLDQCHVAGTCDTGTGLCSNPAIADSTPCDDHNADTCRDSCTNGVCGGSTDPVACVDFFKCYAARTKQGMPRFATQTVTLADEFETKKTLATRPVQICNPASENNGRTLDGTTHLTCYAIRDASTKPRQQRFTPKNLQTTNVLKGQGGDKVRASRPQMVCMPTEQFDAEPSSMDMDHFKCYAAGIQRGTSRFTALDVPVADTFENKLTKVSRPVQICNPVSEDGGAITRPTAHLECYAIRDATKPRQSRFTKRDVTATDSFGSETLTVTRPTTMCVPSLTTPMQ